MTSLPLSLIRNTTLNSMNTRNCTGDTMPFTSVLDGEHEDLGLHEREVRESCQHTCCLWAHLRHCCIVAATAHTCGLGILEDVFQGLGGFDIGSGRIQDLRLEHWNTVEWPVAVNASVSFTWSMLLTYLLKASVPSINDEGPVSHIQRAGKTQVLDWRSVKLAHIQIPTANVFFLSRKAGKHGQTSSFWKHWPSI